MPWDDLWGTAVAVGISLLLAWTSHEQGRLSYRTGFYLSTGNILISLAGLASEGGYVIGGWWAAPYYLGVSTIAYFTALGALVAFRDPRNVKCFRCEYVDWPSETNEQRTPFDNSEWHQFRKLHWEGERKRRHANEAEN